MEVVGETEGFDSVELNPDGTLVHEYVSFETADAPIDIDDPEQIAVFGVTNAAGSGLTVIFTESCRAHPAEIVSFK